MGEAPIEDVFGIVGSTLEGRFVVERVVAEGGFGVVYYAKQIALDRPIALKVLKTPKHFGEEERKHFLAGFAAEAKTVARITHVSIVQVFDFGVSAMPSGAQAAWMALEWLTGMTLEDELYNRRGAGGRSPSECLALIKPVLSAVALVHREGIAHRDIKPANIMLVAGPGGPTPKLLDFGIAKLMDADETPGSGHTRTRSNQIAFSPGYAAPEQISQGRSGPWTDVHAMGLVVTEVLTDSPPFQGEEMAVLVQQIVNSIRPTPARRGVDVGAWETVLQRALAFSAGQRYRDAGEFLAALESTVSEASTAYRRAVTTLSGSAPPGARKEDTLAVMSTQLVPGSAPLPKAPRSATTHSPFSQSGSIEGPQRRSVVPWVVGGAAVAATLGLFAWRGSGREAVSPAANLAISASLAPDSGSPGATPPLPSAPATTSIAPATASSSAPATSGAAATPPSSAPAPKPAPAPHQSTHPSAAASAAPKKGIVIE